MLRVFAAAIVFAWLASPSFANPCAEVERAQKALVSGFASEPLRKDGSTEYLTAPLFGDDSCYITRPWAATSKRRITCILADYAGDQSEMETFARTSFDRLAQTMRSCLTTHDPFDNRAKEKPDDRIVDRSHFRSHDGRETWSLTAEASAVPSAILHIEYETDAAEAQKAAAMPEFLQNVLAGQACGLYRDMETLARANFTGVETKRVRTENAMVKPLDGADECLVARDQMRKENIIACNWIRETPDHAKWASTIQAIRLKAARSCRKGWSEAAKTYEIEFAAPNGDKISVGTRTGPDISVTGVAVTVKWEPQEPAAQ
jgi:hypothetical protein